jgi:hypothetical protein
MSTDLIERLERPEYTGENRCAPCTAVNLLAVAALAALVGRRRRRLGGLTLLAGAALVSLRGYLVPGTPGLTERYLPESVLAAFGKADRPAPMDPALARRAADRAAEEGTAETVHLEVTEADDSAGEADADPADREELDDLLEGSMDRVLEAFEVVEEGDDDLVLVDSFREAWEGRIDALAADPEARRAALAEVVEEPPPAVGIERREDGRYYGLVDGGAVHNWITEAAMLSDLAAHRALDGPRWDRLEPVERLSVLRGFRVFVTTCPECGGPVSATDDVVESCCGAWAVVAVECGDCGARVLELEAPDEAGGRDPAPADPGPGGFTR